MDNETLTILQEQLLKLPKSVVAFLAAPKWNDDLDAIASMYNLEEEQLSSFKREAALVLAGLIPVDEFGASLEEEIGLKGAVLEAVVNATEQKVFSSVRADLVAFFEEEKLPEEELSGAVGEKPSEEERPATPKEAIVSKTVVAPVNLPTEPEEAPFIPPVPPKVAIPKTEQPSAAPHPFEEKLKQVFTSGQPGADNLVLEPVPAETPVALEPSFVPPTITPGAVPLQQPPAAPTPETVTPQPVIPPITPRKDPYREPIE